MQRMLWFPLYIDHFMASKKVLRMTIGEQGAYLRLLMFAWTDSACSLPRDVDELKDMALWMPETHGNFDRVRACFLPHPEKKKTRLYNPRLYEEWVKVEDLKVRRKQAAETRWKQPAKTQLPDPPLRRFTEDRSGKGFESIGQIADKVFPPK